MTDELKQSSSSLQPHDYLPQGEASARWFLESSGTFVLFVDVLGFAELVEEDEARHIEWAAKISPLFASVRGGPQESVLRDLFSRFHRSIQSALEETERFRPPAIVFSDSAFIVESDLQRVTGIARSLMRRLLEEEVPARMGIGFGGFKAARFSTETTGARTHHVSEFYGTPVVRAHRAESCGLRGMRIFLHPSVMARVAESRAEGARAAFNKPLAEAATVALPEPSPKFAITHELNNLAQATHRSLDKRVEAMKLSAPPSFHAYYDETLFALDRMRKNYSPSPTINAVEGGSPADS